VFVQLEGRRTALICLGDWTSNRKDFIRINDPTELCERLEYKVINKEEKITYPQLEQNQLREEERTAQIDTPGKIDTGNYG
ncbi:hypothetical protein SERLA73DRAFT_143246, partial [Serpula lacrymans var. lacrymans S7.3]